MTVSEIDPRVAAVRAGLRLLCYPREVPARVEGGVLHYFWHPDEGVRNAMISEALAKSGVLAT